MSPSVKLCAYCGKAPRDAAIGAFCSTGCGDRDFLQWLGEGYSIPVAAEEAQALDKHGDDGLNAALRAGQAAPG